jgi:hypothetical protein
VQKERYRSAIGLRPFDEIVGDLSYGFRPLFLRTKPFAMRFFIPFPVPALTEL